MDNITAAQVLEWVISHLWQIIITLGVFFEITPIKINPISAIVNLLFKPINTKIDNMQKDIKNDIDSVRKEFKEEIGQIKQRQENEESTIKELIRSNEMTEISRIRWEILEFSNSLKNEQLHTRDEYRHIFDDNERYHYLIDKYGLTNGIITEEFEKIQKHYDDNKNCTSVYF